MTCQFPLQDCFCRHDLFFQWCPLLVWIPQFELYPKIFVFYFFSFFLSVHPMNKPNVCSRYIYGIIISPSALLSLSMTSLYLSSCFWGLHPSLFISLFEWVHFCKMYAVIFQHFWFTCGKSFNHPLERHTSSVPQWAHTFPTALAHYTMSNEEMIQWSCCTNCSICSIKTLFWVNLLIYSLHGLLKILNLPIHLQKCETTLAYKLE